MFRNQGQAFGRSFWSRGFDVLVLQGSLNAGLGAAIVVGNTEVQAKPSTHGPMQVLA